MGLISKRLIRHYDIIFSEIFAVASLLVLLAPLIVVTIYRRITRKRKVLTPDSTILITGGCMGIGRELALMFASNNKCNIIVYDIRADLSESLCSYASITDLNL